MEGFVVVFMVVVLVVILLAEKVLVITSAAEDFAGDKARDRRRSDSDPSESPRGWFIERDHAFFFRFFFNLTSGTPGVSVGCSRGGRLFFFFLSDAPLERIWKKSMETRRRLRWFRRLHED